MRQLLKSLVVGAVAISAQNALAGGLPESGSSGSGATTSASTGSIASSATNSAASTGSASSASFGSSGSSGSGGSAGSSSAQNSGAGFIAIEDDPLIVDASAIMDDDGMGNVQVQWQISSDGEAWMNLTGAVQQSFTPREIHVGQQLRVQISYVDGQGNLETLVSPASTPVQNVNDKPTGAPRLAGEAREEGALVVDTSLIADEDGVGTYSVIWQRSSTKTDWQAYPNAIGEVLQLTQNHVGYSYRAVVSYTDRHGTKELLLTNPSETVSNVDDPVEGEVLLAGEAAEGSTLVANTARVSDEDGIASLTVGWEASEDGRNWRAIETAGTSRFGLTQTMVGKQVRARVSVVDSFGVETIIFSQATNTVKNVNNAPAGTIFVRRVGS
ncbi:MAG: hypothetical protein ISP48_05950 [Candidatus Puniceispirillum sp.]|nr:hypothetical protein [Candidatus Puniceispirillum sp.]